jgi:hypothetical protein
MLRQPLPRPIQGSRCPVFGQAEQLAKYDSPDGRIGQRLPRRAIPGYIADKRGPGADTLGQTGADVVADLIRRALPAMSDDLSQPAGEVRRRWGESTHAGQIEMGVGVDQTGQHGAVAEIEVGLASAVRLDGDDAFAGNSDDAAGQWRPGDGEKPASGQGQRESHLLIIPLPRRLRKGKPDRPSPNVEKALEFLDDKLLGSTEEL